MRFTMRLIVAMIAAATLTSCGVKPIARTVNDVARDLCAIFFSEKQGISFEDAAKTVCTTREVLDPFIREVLKAQQAAGAAAAPNDGAPADENAPPVE